MKLLPTIPCLALLILLATFTGCATQGKGDAADYLDALARQAAKAEAVLGTVSRAAREVQQQSGSGVSPLSQPQTEKQPETAKQSQTSSSPSETASPQP